LKKGSNLGKRDTLRKRRLHLEKRVTLAKMGHTRKTGSDLDKKGCNPWKNGRNFEK